MDASTQNILKLISSKQMLDIEAMDPETQKQSFQKFETSVDGLVKLVDNGVIFIYGVI